jgi:tRNA modification GTPase
MADTIAAIATGGVLSAIGIIRLSGGDVLGVIDRVFRPKGGAPMSERQDRRLVYGELLDRDGKTIDLCLCTVSRGPHSYTGEDTAELQCHGSPVVLREGLESLFAAGARQALAGEFTKRAFLNGRMDLTQAEAVIDLINAETAEAARNAAGQIGGAMQRRIDGIYSALGDISAHFHAVIDYPDEDIEPFELESYSETLKREDAELRELAGSFERGKAMQAGVPAVILGRPNAGKSSLLNALLGYDRAIVTDIPGTTRDTLTERVRLGGVLLRLTDTAGLRETDDGVERLGVERARDAARSAELALVLIDPGAEDGDWQALRAAQGVRSIILILTKSDLYPDAVPPELPDGLRADAVLRVSSKEKAGLDELAQIVKRLYPLPVSPAGEILTNARQAEAVARARESLAAAMEAMDARLTPDLVLTETEQAMSALGEVTGKVPKDDITSRIFERFCVGK